MGLSVFYVRVQIKTTYSWLPRTPLYFRVGASSQAAAAQRSVRAALKTLSGQHTEFVDVIISRHARFLIDRTEGSDVGIPSIEEMPAIGKFPAAAKQAPHKIKGPPARLRFKRRQQ